MARFDTVFNIDGNTQTITLASGGTIRAKSKHYFYAKFQFNDGTRDVDPFLTLENLSAVFSPVPFERNRGGAYIVPLPQSAPYECEIPWEVLTRKGKVYVGIFAGDMLVTNEAEINVTHAAPVLGADSQPTQSWWARFSAAIAELTAAIRGKQDILTAGENITITDNVISATGGAAIEPSSTAPLMDGAASAGTATTYARGDHRHPSDATKQNVDYVIHVVNGVVTETPADIAAAYADTSRRVVLDVDGFIYDRYLYIPEPGAGEPDVYLYWQPTISGTSSIMEVRGLYLSPSAATVTERLYSTLMAVGDNVSLLVNDVGYLTEHQSLVAYRTAAAQDIIDQAQDTAIAAKYSKPGNGIPASDLASGVIPSVPSASSATPQALGTAAAGSSADYSHADHVHDFNDDFKSALLQLAAKVAYVDSDGQTYYDALEAALTHKVLSSITAVFTQGQNVVYASDSLDTLKQYLVVTANYSDNTSETVTNYTLSGTLSEGTSTVTVTYRNKTATFNATVTYSVDVAPSLSTFQPGNATYAAVAYNASADTLRIYSKSSWTYVSAKIPFTAQRSGYDYVVSYDVIVTSGDHRSGFANANNQVRSPWSGQVLQNSHVEYSFPYSAEVTQFFAYCTWSPAANGDCTISNFHIYERRSAA